MFAALLSFLGGSVFRMLFGEISSWMNKKQDHAHEMDRMRMQGDLENAQFLRNQEALRLQSELGVKLVHVQAEAVVDQIEANGWLAAVKGTTQTIGVWFIDAWNGVIRPFVATWAVIMVTLHFAQTGWILDDNGWSLCGAALGIYLADRSLFKRGK
jgi:hypothetical protein